MDYLVLFFTFQRVAHIKIVITVMSYKAYDFFPYHWKHLLDVSTK